MNKKSPLSILIVDDEEVTSRSLSALLDSLGHDPHSARNGEEGLGKLEESHYDLLITDLMMPGMDGFSLVKRAKKLYPAIHVFIFTGHDSFSLARKALKLGADDFLLKPIDKDQITIALHQAEEKIRLKNKIVNLGKLVETTYSISSIIGSSEPMQQVFRLIEKARSTRANVLIRGGSGTGKELVARAIYSHHASEKHHFVHVNCCAITESLFESELFGHVKGSFSGAISDRQGLFETADNGTMFLDEIGDISQNIQMKLLRAIQEGEIRRVGENRVRKVNVRLLAATNKNLEKAVEKGEFREDLYYRLNVIPISLPALRERLSDIPELASHFMKKHTAGGPKKELSPDAMKLLQSYGYPGNVRELENIIQRAISFSSGSIITGDDIRLYLQHQPAAGYMPGLDAVQAMSYPDMKAFSKKLEREYLLFHLKNSKGNVIQTAAALSLSRTALHNRIKSLEIDIEDLRE